MKVVELGSNLLNMSKATAKAINFELDFGVVPMYSEALSREKIRSPGNLRLSEPIHGPSIVFVSRNVCQPQVRLNALLGHHCQF